MFAPLAIALLLTPPAPAPPEWHYPLTHTPSVTAVFGTFRIGHHHAGLDLYTDDRTDVKVVAAADGEIYRIQRNHSGYGRGLYVRHAGGYVSVYGHLAAFSPRLEALEKTLKVGPDGYKIKTNLKPIAVKAGEHLGWIGTSGTDLVHLHFELRHKGTPVNPLRHGLPVPDTQAPKIQQLFLSPQTARSQVAGGFSDQFVDLSGDASPVVEIAGAVELSVNVEDRIDGSSRALAPYRVALMVDGKLWHETRYDQVSYGDKAEPELDYIAEFRAHKKGLFHRMTPVGPRARVQRKRGRSLTRLRKGDHAAEIVAEDAAGGVSRKPFTLRVAPYVPSGITVRKKLRRGKAVSAPRGIEWRAQSVAVPLPAEPLEVAVRWRGKRYRKVAATRIGARPALAVDLPEGETGALELTYRQPGAAAQTISLDVLGLENGKSTSLGGTTVEVGDEALFVPYVTHVAQQANPGKAGLTPASDLYVFANGWIPTRARSSVQLTVPKAARGKPGLGLYFNEREKWWRMSGVNGRTVRAGIVHPGAVAFMQDLSPPTVGEAVVETQPYGRRVIVPVSDISSLRSVKVLLDGKPVSPERQRAMKRLILRPEGLEGGAHRLKISVEDRAGNHAEVERHFTW